MRRNSQLQIVVQITKGSFWRIWWCVAIALAISVSSFAQKTQLVQVKTFDQQLTPYRNVEISINGKEYFALGNKGTAFV